MEVLLSYVAIFLLSSPSLCQGIYNIQYYKVPLTPPNMEEYNGSHLLEVFFYRKPENWETVVIYKEGNEMSGKESGPLDLEQKEA